MHEALTARRDVQVVPLPRVPAVAASAQHRCFRSHTGASTLLPSVRNWCLPACLHGCGYPHGGPLDHLTIRRNYVLRVVTKSMRVSGRNELNGTAAIRFSSACVVIFGSRT